MIQAKSIYEAAEPGDGYRVLATRYWPRGVSKARCDKYVSEIAPSRALLHAFREGELDWDAFRERYLAELAGSEDAQAHVAALRTKAHETMVTVMCVCKNPFRCHRTLLAGVLAGDDAP